MVVRRHSKKQHVMRWVVFHNEYHMGNLLSYLVSQIKKTNSVE